MKRKNLIAKRKAEKKQITIKDLKLSLKNPSETRHRFMVPSSGLYLWKIKY